LDFYTVALHEITHALGFISLINSTGNSVFGASNKYYSRYDLFLRTQGNQNLITNNGNICSMYAYTFNPQLNSNVLAPSGIISAPNDPDCSSQLKFAGTVNQLTYTPSSFDPGSSLSHLEDLCHLPVGTGYADDQYYLMSNSGSFGPLFMKRFLKPEERRVLCDIGYKVNTTCGNSTNLTYVNYGGSQCGGQDVVGVNDGIIQFGPSAVSFQHITTVGAPPLLISGVCNNDWNTVSFECLQNLYNNGTINVSSGTNFTFTATAPGIAVLRYIPVSSSGKRGNITYIYVYVKSANCNPSLCSFINNSGFESSTTCGQLGDLNPSIILDCWTKFTNTPDVFKRNCSNPSASVASQLTIPTPYNSPPSDTWNGFPNNGFLGVLSSGGTGFPHLDESAQTLLNFPLIPGNSYTLSFRYKLRNTAMMTAPLPPNGLGSITFAGSGSILVPLSTGLIATTALPSSVTQLGSPFTVVNDNQWHLLTQTFTYNGLINLNNLIVMNTSNMNTLVNQPDVYVFIDDVNLTEVNPATALTFPDILCINQSIADMSIYAPVPGGTFSGPGVSSSSGIFSFSSTIAGVGTHIITYTYTTINGCVLTIYDQIQVAGTSLFGTASALPQNACVGQTVTLSGASVGATSLTWNPGNISGSTFSTVFSAPTLYTLTATNSAGCVATASVQVNAAPPATITVSPSTSSTCPGQQVTLTASGGNSYSWSPNVALSAITGASVSASPTATQMYTLTGTNASGCSASVNSTITVLPCTDCMSGPGTVWSGTITNQTPAANSTIRIPNNISISGNVTLTGNNVKIMSNVTITVLPNATLNVNGAHLYACDKMWQGIVVQPGGKINIQPYILSGNIQKTALIEDAIVALDFVAIPSSQPAAMLQVNNATFNKNATAIRIQGYPFANASSAFLVKNSLFTCRNIYNSVSATWPLTTAVKAANNNTNQFLEPYISVYPLTYMKLPLNSSFSEKGIQMNSVGMTVTSTPYAYNSITIGSAIAAEHNVFDNLKVGIHAENSNLKIINTTFQFTREISNSLFNSGGIPNTGTGIYANWYDGPGNKLDVAGTAAQPNKFYGLSRAIHTNKYRDVQCVYNTIRSNRQNTVPFGGYNNGRFGVYMTVSSYDNVQVSNNTIYNIDKGVYLGANLTGNFPNVKVLSNTFNNALSSTTGAISSDAILLENLLGSLNYNGLVWVNSNTIEGSYSGITLKYWKKATIRVNSNTITLGSISAFSTTTSNGIAMVDCEMGAALSQINDNVISGFNSSMSSSKGISLITSSNTEVRCNKVSNTYSGLYFSGNCNGTRTYKNDMQNHKYGFTLDNGGVIGQQGSSTVPADNRWLGLAATWTGGNYKNACLNTSLTQNSPMYVRSGAAYTPNLSVFSGSGSYPYTANASPTITLPPLISIPTAYTLCALAQIQTDTVSAAQMVSILESNTDPNNAPANADMEAVVLNQSYRILDADTTLMQSSTELSTFYADNAVSNMAKLLTVEKAVADNNLSLATAENALIIPGNTMEESYKLLYDALLNYQNGTFSSTDSLTITEIALGCPTLQGSAVSQAATLYNLVYQTAEVFDNYCPEWVDKSMLISTENNSNGEQELSYSIYPIPNNGTFYLTGKLENGYQITISNSDGRKVFEMKFNAESKQEFIQTNLASGAYTVFVKNSNKEEVYKQKIIILE